MIVHALRGAGLRAGLAGGRAGRRRAGNAEWGEGEWLVVEADESDRSMLSLNVEIARADERRARPPRDASARWRSCERRFARSWRGRRGGRLGTGRSCSRCAARRVVAYDAERATTLDARGLALPVARARGRAAVPGAHNALNAPARWRPRGWPAPTRHARDRGLAGFRGAGRRFQLLGVRPRAGRWSTTTTPTTRPRSRDAEAARTLEHGAAGGGLPAAPLLAHRAARARVRRGAGAGRRGGRCWTSTRRASARRTSRGERAADRRGRGGRGPGGRCTGCRRFADAEPVLAATCCS
jgi:hypothetical protein